jgi:hypothetical protein
MNLNQHFRQSLGLSNIPLVCETSEDRAKMQGYLDTHINANWPRTRGRALVYFVLCAADEKDRAVSRKMVGMTGASIDDFARKVADELDAEIVRYSTRS